MQQHPKAGRPKLPSHFSMEHIERAKGRLEIYRDALRYFRNRAINPFLNAKYCDGFCYYFTDIEGLDILGSNLTFQRVLPELWATNPHVWFKDTGYWFKPGRLSPRIKCLKKAIRITEQSIKNYEAKVRILVP